MRVPDTGLNAETRAIVREGYALAERMLRDYRDPPTLADTLGNWLTRCRAATLDLYRALARN